MLDPHKALYSNTNANLFPFSHLWNLLTVTVTHLITQSKYFLYQAQSYALGNTFMNKIKLMFLGSGSGI